MKSSLGQRFVFCLCMLLFIAVSCDVTRGGQYRNFRVAVHIPAGVVERMKDPQWLQRTWETISLQLKVDKVSIETYRSQRIVDEQLIEQVKKFFLDRGVQVAGGIAHTSADARQFEAFSYADPKERGVVCTSLVSHSRAVSQVVAAQILCSWGRCRITWEHFLH